MSCKKLDFNFCAIMPGFCKSSRNYSRVNLLICIYGSYSVETEAQLKFTPCNAIAITHNV